MFFIGDKVEYPLTQSINTNSDLSVRAKLLIKAARNQHQNYLVVREISYSEGVYKFDVSLSTERYYNSTQFLGCDLVPYGHSGLVFYPATAHTNRVKCHCGKTHQLISTSGHQHEVYKDYVDSSGWYVRLNNLPIRKPRGAAQYVYYVAYCPECWTQEQLRRNSASIELQSISSPSMEISQTTQNLSNVIDSNTTCQASQPVIHSTRTAQMPISVSDAWNTVEQDVNHMHERLRIIIVPKSIWVHHGR
jgi:hypothetical protein